VPVLELAKAAGVGERTARRALAWAIRTGMIQRSRRGRGAGTATATASAWQLAVPEAPSLAANPGESGGQFEDQAANSTKAARHRGRAGQPKVPSSTTTRPKLTKAELADLKDQVARFRRRALTQPPCQDGEPGGDQEGPDGRKTCPFCDGRAVRT
jgi:hypothetical protein